MKAVIIYDHSAIATKANAMLDRATYRADESVQWNVKPWRVDVMIQPTAAKPALEDADLSCSR